MVVPDILTVSAAFRQALEQQERAALVDMASAYAAVQDDLGPAIERLAEQIEALREAEGDLSPSKLFSLERYRILERQLLDEMERLSAQLEGRIVRQQAAAIELGQESAIEQVKAAFGQQYGQTAADALRLTRLPVDALTDLVGFLAPESPLRASLERLGPLAAQQIQRGLIAGLALGRGPRETARLTREAFGGNLTHALRVTRTSQLYAHRSAALRLYQQNDDVVTGWRWNAARNARTCPACLANHGRVFPLSTPMRSHWSCRCAASPVVRGTRIRFQTGEEWFRQQPDAVQRDILGIAAHRAYRNGLVRLTDFLGQRHDATLGTVYQRRALREIIRPDEMQELMAAN